MSNKKDNFAKLFDYFNGEDEDSEEEIENYQQNYNNMIKAKETQKNKEAINNNKYIGEQNQIITELYSDNEEDEDDNNDINYNREKRIIQNIDDENNFENLQFISFKPKNNDINNINNIKEENKTKQNDDNIKKEINNLNNEDNINSNNDDIYTKIIVKQISFGKDNDNINKNNEIKKEKIEENKQIKNQEIKNEYNPEYLINSKIFDELEKEEKEKKEENQKTQKKKKNKIEWRDKNVIIKRKINDLKIYMKKNIKMEKEKEKENDTKKKPVELILYYDAIKKRKKYENLNRNTITENELNSNRTKIDKISYQKSMEYDDKKIESVIKKYTSLNKNKNISLINICLILQELKIFRKLLENINTNKLENINDINEFKNRISIVIKENELRKKKELNFLEQIWSVLNFKKNYINNDIFEGFLKILFSSPGNITDTFDIIKQYIKAASFEDILDNNQNDKIKDCVKNFFSLKENSLAYKNIGVCNNEKYKKIIKEREKNLTFAPNIERNEGYQSKLNKRRKNFNCNTLYDRFLKKEEERQNNIKKMKTEKIKKEMKEVKQKPKISKYKTNNIYDEEIHEKLYNQGNYMRKKKQEKIEEKEKEEKLNLEKEFKTFRLNLNSKKNRRRMAKSFDNTSKPKGFDEYIIRNRKEILNKEKLKQQIEKIPCGENYEKIRKRTITPFNITDLRKEKFHKKKKEGEYFTMKIKIPNGQERTLKINIKNDPYKIANNFCKIYSIKENGKQKLIKNIINCQNVYLNINKDDINICDDYY